MGTRSLYFSYWLQYWTVLRHHGRMNWKRPPEDLGDLTFMHDELMENYFVIYEEYSELCSEGLFDDVLEVSPISGEGMKDDISRMVFGH